MPLPSSLACVRRAAVALVAAALALAAACGENPVAPGTGGVGGSTAGAPAVGTVLRLNTYINPSDPCDSVRSGFRGGRVAAVGARSIIVADTANPAGGFTSADYASFAATFDTLVYPVGVRHFGEPTDLDRNGRVIVFFTAAVNALTPRNVDYIVGGYFSARDLFPRGGRDACVGSNDGELFYMLAPDPSGAVNGNARSRDYVLRTSMGVLAHEFQHLISASRRLYVVQTANFQDRVWLDEGLSHIAEELTYYRASGLGPMRRLTLDSVRRTTPRLNALNNYNLSNLGRLTSYLAAPEDNSPYAPDDSLATRGATVELPALRRRPRRGRRCGRVGQRALLPARQLVAGRAHQPAHRGHRRGRHAGGARRLVPRLGGVALRRRPRPRARRALYAAELGVP
jgi:hypothetical protein